MSLCEWEANGGIQLPWNDNGIQTCVRHWTTLGPEIEQPCVSNVAHDKFIAPLSNDTITMQPTRCTAV